MQDQQTIPNNPRDLTFYGPHACPKGCGTTIVMLAEEQGGTLYDIPHIPYPNSEWPIHVCDPAVTLPTRSDARMVVADINTEIQRQHAICDFNNVSLISLLHSAARTIDALAVLIPDADCNKEATE
jgi:hypothetical protein